MMIKKQKPIKQPRKLRPGKRIQEAIEERSEMMLAAEAGLDFVNTMVNLEELTPARVPDNIPATSAVFKSRIIRSLPSCAPWVPAPGRSEPLYDDTKNGESVVALFPGVNGSLWYTRGAEATWDFIGSGAALNMEPYLVTTEPAAGGNVYANHALRSETFGLLPRLNADGIPIYELNMGNKLLAADPRSFLVQFIDRTPSPNAGGVTVQVVMTDDLGGTQIAAFPDVLTGQTFPIVLLRKVVSFYVEFLNARPSANWTFGFGTTPALDIDIWQSQYSAGAYIVEDAPGLGDLDLTDAERTTALTLLASYLGSDLQNGGAIAYARLPLGLTPIEAINGDIYGFLAQLPLYCGDYALRDGAFVWWCPDTLQEFFFQPYLYPRCQYLDQTSSIWIAMKRDDPSQEVRINANIGVEVTTRSFLYSSEVGPVNPSFSQVIAIAKQITAGSHNPIHKSLFKRIIAKAKRVILNKKNWVRLLTSGAKFLEKTLASPSPVPDVYPDYTQ